MRWPTLTLVAGVLPGQMAARLAGMTAVAGLDIFVAGSPGYALLGTNRWLSAGADSRTAPALAAGVAAVAVAGTSGYGVAMALHRRAGQRCTGQHENTRAGSLAKNYANLDQMANYCAKSPGCRA